MKHGHDRIIEGCFQCQLEAVHLDLLALRKFMSAESDKLQTSLSNVQDAVNKLLANMPTTQPNPDAVVETSVAAALDALTAQVTAATPAPPATPTP